MYNEKILIRISRDLKKKSEAVAEANNMTVSGLIRYLLEVGTEDNGRLIQSRGELQDKILDTVFDSMETVVGSSVSGSMNSLKKELKDMEWFTIDDDFDWYDNPERGG